MGRKRRHTPLIIFKFSTIFFPLCFYSFHKIAGCVITRLAPVFVVHWKPVKAFLAISFTFLLLGQPFHLLIVSSLSIGTANKSWLSGNGLTSPASITGRVSISALTNCNIWISNLNFPTNYFAICLYGFVVQPLVSLVSFTVLILFYLLNVSIYLGPLHILQTPLSL